MGGQGVTHMAQQWPNSGPIVALEPLARSGPYGHPPLQTARPLAPAAPPLWARKESPRRLDVEERPRQRSCRYLPSIAQHSRCHRLWQSKESAPTAESANLFGYAPTKPEES